MAAAALPPLSSTACPFSPPRYLTFAAPFTSPQPLQDECEDEEPDRQDEDEEGASPAKAAQGEARWVLPAGCRAPARYTPLLDWSVYP